MIEKKIKKPWCVYGGKLAATGLFPWRGYGKIIEEFSVSVGIAFTENQNYYYSVLCDSRFVMRFSTLLEAVEEFYAKQDRRSGKKKTLEKLKEEAREDFPSEN